MSSRRRTRPRRCGRCAGTRARARCGTCWRCRCRWRPERRLADPGSGYLRNHLSAWSSPASSFPDEEAAATYQSAISLWPSPHCALEFHRWLVRSRVRSDGREFDRFMRTPVGQPVLSVWGADDPALPHGAFADTRRHVLGPLTEHAMPGVGHFPPEEAPDAFTRLLLAWLAGL